MSVLAGWIAVTRGKRIVWVAWALTLVFAAVVAAPVAVLLAVDLGHSLFAARMLDNFDPQWMAEFAYASRGWPLAALPPAAAVLGVGFALLTTFLTGGALAVFVSAGSYDTATFWEGCAKHFWRLLRVLLLLLLAYLIVFLVTGAFGSIGRKIWGDGMEERPLVIFGWVRAAITVLLLLAVAMIFDYAKICIVAETGRSAFRAAAAALRFVARNPGPTAATYALLCAVAVALAAAYWTLSALLPRNTLAWLALVFAVQQAFVFARCWVKLWFLASQTELYMALRPAPAVAEPAPAPVVPDTAPELSA